MKVVSNNGKIKFTLPGSKSFNETSIRNVDFSTREYNSLMRNCLTTVGMVVDNIDRNNLNGIGKVQVDSIKKKLFMYYWNSLDADHQIAYLVKLAGMNDDVEMKGDSER